MHRSCVVLAHCRDASSRTGNSARAIPTGILASKSAEAKGRAGSAQSTAQTNANAAAARGYLRSLPCAELVGFHSSPRLQTHLHPTRACAESHSYTDSAAQIATNTKTHPRNILRQPVEKHR